MMDYPLVSIVIPTYNQQLYIVRAVESALMQDYDKLEVIVSDDSPNENTKEILQQYINDQKIRYIHNEPRLGRVANYRTCLYKYARGNWVVNLDGDDFLTDKEFISSAINAINGDESIVFVIAGGTIKFPDGSEIKKRIPGTKFPSRKISGKRYFWNFAKRRGFFHLTILYNAKIARSIDFYRYNILSSDLESFLRLALHGNVILLDRNVGVWFLHNNNTSSSAEIQDVIENVKWIDTVTLYAITQKRLSHFLAKTWNFLVKEQELSGMFIRKFKMEASHNHRIKLFKYIFINHPRTFFFPVFIKKIIDFYLLKK